MKTIVIALVVAAYVTAQVRADDPDAALIRMKELLGKFQPKEVIAEFGNEDFSKWPTTARAKAVEALQLRGRAYMSVKAGLQAEADFKQAGQLAPKSAATWLLRGENYLRNLNDDDKALAAFDESRKLTGASKGWEALTAALYSVQILTDQLKTDEALARLAPFGDLSDLPPIWRIKMLRAYGHIYASQGKESESLEKFREALALESPEAERTTAAPQPKSVPKTTPSATYSTVPGLKSELLAGTAKVEITPPAGSAVDLLGQPLEPREPLHARVLVLKDKSTSIALVTLDLIVFSSRKVIESAKEKWGVEHVILSATHTHAGASPRGLVIKPPMSPDWTRNGKDPGVAIDWDSLSSDPWYADTEQKVIEAIGRATKSLSPARLVAGKGFFESAYLSHNRRLVRDGRSQAFWENPNRLPTQPVDPTVGVIRVEDMSSKPRAFVVHYGCHPVATMGAGVVSRDFPGAMVDYLEEQLGPDCLAMFLQGAQGDIDPYDLHNLRGENRFRIMRQSGISLAKGALRIAAELKTESAPPTSLHVIESVLPIPYRSGPQTTEVGIATIRLSPDLAFVAIPGELFVQHQLNLRANSPFANTFLLGLAYHGSGSPFVLYVPTVQAVKEGGYGATECSFVASDAGDRMMAEAVARLKHLARETP